MTPMEWHKISSYRWLTGSIRKDLNPDERSVWADLLAMASLSRRRGYVERSEGIGFDREFIASFLTISIELLSSTLEKCIAEGRIQEQANGVLFVTHFEAYQAIPEDKRKMTPRELELYKRATIHRYSKEFPKEAASVPEVIEVVHDNDKDREP